jgi:hypothetical protein
MDQSGSNLLDKSKTHATDIRAENLTAPQSEAPSGKRLPLYL